MEASRPTRGFARAASSVFSKVVTGASIRNAEGAGLLASLRFRRYAHDEIRIGRLSPAIKILNEL
jgi:hypothetical protein